MEYIWLGIVIILAIIECLTINLTTIWFVLSGIIALIISIFTDSFLLQFGLFSILGVILMILTKPLLTKKLKVKSVRTNLDRIIGMEGVVTETIQPFEPGEVKVDGKRWTAIAKTMIETGTLVRIDEISGVKVKVSILEG